MILLSPFLLPTAFAVLGFGCSPALSNDDALLRFFCWYRQKIDMMPLAAFWTIVRLALALTLQTLFCAWVFSYCREKVNNACLASLQWLACLSVLFAVAQVPLKALTLPTGVKSFSFSMSLFAIAVLPSRLSWLLLPKEGHRKILSAAVYVACLFLFVIQNIRSA